MYSKYDSLSPDIHRVVERRWWSGRTLELTELAEHHLTYALSGEAVYTIEGREYTVTGGDIIYIPKGCSRKATANPKNPIHLYNVMFDFFDTGQESIILPINGSVKIGHDNDVMELYQKLNQLWLNKKVGYILEARAIFLLILHRVLYYKQRNELQGKGNPAIEEIKEYIGVNYYRHITNTELASRVNMHPVYMGAYFKKYTGQTISEYITQIRISKAEDLLLSGEYTMKEIACECGYDNIYYFSKIFKQEKGICPSKFRTSIKE